MVKFLLINEIGAAIVDALRTFLGFLCKIIYPLIKDAWDLFIALSKAQIFNSEGDGIVNDMYTKVGLVLGLFMLFRVIFSLFQMFLNPDTLTDKEKGIGSIVKRAMVVIILLAMTPKIFGWAFQLQEIVIDDGVITKFVLGTDPSDQDVKKFGSALSLNLFRNFYVLDSYNEEAAFNECQTYKLTFAELYDYGTLDLIDQCLTTKYDAGKIAASEEAQQEFNISADIDEDYERYAINFTLNGVLAVVAGLGVLYIIITYCVYLGARVIQLAFLQIIAPIPIISYLTPQKDNGLSKWAKICISTYIDAFIRIALVYFIALIISNIISEGQEGLDNLIASTDITKDNPLYAYLLIFIILGLLMVAKKVPDLLGEIFPSLGAGKGKLGFGLSWKKMTDNMLGWKAISGTAKWGAKTATGVATGAAIGFLGGKGVGGKVSGFFGGLGRGAISGFKKGGVFKNISNVAGAQSAANRKHANWKNAGGRSVASRGLTGLEMKLGLPTEYERYEAEIAKLENKKVSFKSSTAAAKNTHSAFDGAASTGKDAKRAARSAEALGNSAFEYLKEKNVISALTNAGVNISASDSFASVLERSQATKENLGAKINGIDNTILNLQIQKATASQSEQAKIDKQIKMLEKVRSDAVSQYESINIGDIEKKVGEARMGNFLLGQVSDGKAESEFNNAMSIASTAIDTLKDTAVSQEDIENINTLETYLSAIYAVKPKKDANGNVVCYDFAQNGDIVIGNNSYKEKDAYKLYDDMLTLLQEMFNNGEEQIRNFDEQIRSIKESQPYKRSKADHDHSGGNR